jgi:hypothetical protein
MLDEQMRPGLTVAVMCAGYDGPVVLTGECLIFAEDDDGPEPGIKWWEAKFPDGETFIFAATDMTPID